MMMNLQEEERVGKRIDQTPPAPSTSKRIIVRSRLVKGSVKENLSKEMKDNEKKSKEGKKKRKILIKKLYKRKR